MPPVEFFDVVLTNDRVCVTIFCRGQDWSRVE